MIRVCTASRLHFGLLSLPAGDAGRSYGGVGLMVQQPGVCLTVRPSAAWSATGPLAERALDFAQRFADTVPPAAARPMHLALQAAAAEHVGLGTGTQLGLAVARALADAWGLHDLEVAELARRVGRGRRSAIGLHGFAHGGFLVEAGRGPGGGPGPLVARWSLPEPWRLVLATASGGPGLHGAAEGAVFQQLARAGTNPAVTDTLCRLVLLGMLPALAEHDLAAFGAAVHEFNARVGEQFASVQGGPYASAAVAAMVGHLRQLGLTGVGQSSWGPTVFALAADPEQARDVAGRLSRHFNLPAGTVWVTAASNQGARVETDVV